MPPIARIGRRKACQITTTIATSPLLYFLWPSPPSSTAGRNAPWQSFYSTVSHKDTERAFLAALAQAASCQKQPILKNKSQEQHGVRRRKLSSTPSSFSPASEQNSPGNRQFGYSGSNGSCGGAISTTGLQTEHDGRSINTNKERPTKLDHNAKSTISDSRVTGLPRQARRKLWWEMRRREKLLTDTKPFFERSEDIAAGENEAKKSPISSSISIDETAFTNPFFKSTKPVGPKASLPNPPPTSKATLTEQMRMLSLVRELEEKLEEAKSAFNAVQAPQVSRSTVNPITLTKQDYMNLVDLYFYSHKDRGAPDTPDLSPTPILLENYSFKLSSDFSKATNDSAEEVELNDEDISMLKEIEATLKANQLEEISSMQLLVELLLDDTSSTRALYTAYKRLPQPGVAYLPRGVIRLFLQRMSTPRKKSETAMLRYLSLIDDMQTAKIPITSAEWSSAIYLVGRSFPTVMNEDIANSFRIWTKMEQEAGVKSRNVTFNILFDIAVRGGKFVLANMILKEMYERGLRLNRLGRVSLIYYHGLHGNGDGVRKAYRDFVEAGEIVDTLVLNCVIASLIHAQEPGAAELIYERMKQLQSRYLKGTQDDGSEALFNRYPEAGTDRLGSEMASNSLGRVLLKASHLKDILPEHHADLQRSMPLTPDWRTMHSLLKYHACSSGNLDRLTVLINDMTESFNIPFNSTIFELLFRGFATHGGSVFEDATWNRQRLEIVLKACLSAVKTTKAKETKIFGNSARSPLEPPIMPSLGEIESSDSNDEQLGTPVRKVPSTSAEPQNSRLEAWNTFIADIMYQPTERRGPLSPLQVDIDTDTTAFESPFFPAESDPFSSDDTDSSTSGPDVAVVYTLPTTGDAIAPALATSSSTTTTTSSLNAASVRLNRGLLIWLIRAFVRCTASRTRLEELWSVLRQLWVPADEGERVAVTRALKRALRYVDSGVRR